MIAVTIQVVLLMATGGTLGMLLGKLGDIYLTARKWGAK